MNQMFGQSADPVRPGHGDSGLSLASARPLPVGGSEQAFFHLDLKRSLQLHRRLACGVAIAFVLLGVLYFLSQAFVFKSWPSYEAQSLVYVQPTPPRVLEPNNGGPARWPYDTNTYESYFQQQMMNVSRPDVLASAIKKLPGYLGPGESAQAGAERLVRSLVVAREGEGYQFSIGARAGNPEEAAAIANAVTAAYMEGTTRDQRTGDTQRLTMLREERDRIQNAVVADRNEQDELNKQLGVASIGSAVPDHYDEDITQTRAELIKARTDHDAAEAKFAALDGGNGASSAAIDAQADELISSDAGLVSMKQALNTRRAALVSQMANLTPGNPQYKQDEAELGKIDSTLDSMMKDLRAKAAARIQLQLQADLKRTAGVESTVNGQLRQLVRSAGGATPKLQRSNDLAADITRLQARYATVDEQLHNLILEDSGPAAAYQVTPAVPPLGRTRSGVLRNSLLIALAGLFFGILAAAAANKLDPKVYIASDAELILGFPPMAQLPNFSEVSDGVAEEYLLRLASSIEHARKQSNLRSCVFTGTSGGAGVTTLVNRVQQMLQAMGRPTVLVDATGAQAPHTGSMAREDGPGLVPVERVSRPTALLQQMAEETETEVESLVLTDTAPLAVSAETEYLARFVDCVIVVIESGRTTRRELREVAATLQRLDVGAVGFVLNRVGLKKADPAFRTSIRAIEEHLQAQSSNVARRTERSNAYFAEERSSSEPLPNEGSARTMFEPEVAAVAAAVARFSPQAVSEAAGSRASEPVAQSAIGFTSPEVFEPAISVSTAPVVARYVEAAEHFVSPLGAEAEVPTSTPAVAAPFADVAEHFSPHSVDEPVIQLASSEVIAFDSEVAPHVSSSAVVEPVVPLSPPVAEGPVEFVRLHGVPEELSVHETASTVPVREPEPQPELEEVQPAIETPADVPWWLSDVRRGHSEPTRPPLLWQPARVWSSRKPDAASEHWVTESNAKPEPAQNASTGKSWPADKPSWETASNGRETPSSSGAPQDMQRSELDEVPTNLTSRLSGLRNLLFVLGVKGPHGSLSGSDDSAEGQAGPVSSSHVSSTGLRSERPAVDRTYAQDAEDAASISVGGASPRLITAPPEFLPPRPIVINVDREGVPAGESSTRQDRRAAYDNIQILPSKRGQYKKI